MKKSIKRILCGALSLMMVSTFAIEHTLRLKADEPLIGSTVIKDATFENVTGQYDPTEMVTSNFNSSVQQGEGAATPTYETRTVMISLEGKTLANSAGKSDVSDFAASWSGQRIADEISTQQDAFLRKLSKAGIPYELDRRYDTLLNAVAVKLNTKHVSTIKKMQGVDSVVITTSYAEPETIKTQSTGVVTNQTNVYDTGIYDSSEFVEEYGEGMVVAVLDTGLDYTHNAFQRFMNEDAEVAWTEEDIKEKLENLDLVAERRSGSLEASEVYVSAKVPYTYDYADDEPDVYPSYSNHGTHVAGIIGGYDPNGYTDKDGNPIDQTFMGVVPDAQLAIFKVFTDDLNDPDIGGAVAEDIVAALEDCVLLGVDVINMSLGTSCGFTTTDDGDDEGEMLNSVYEAIKATGITLVAAASNDYSSAYGGVFGTNLSSNPDSSTVGSPSTFASSFSVASINGQKAEYMIANAGTENETYVFYEDSRDIDGNPFDFTNDMLAMNANGEFEYVVIPGIGQSADYTSSIKSLLQDANGNSLGRIALVKRGDTTFQEKVEIAMRMGAAAVMIYNNVAGVIRMNLGEIDDPVPAVSISMNAGNALAKAAVGRIGTLKINPEYLAGPFMSDFSSWGPTHDLKLKPEITAHGGEITSAVPGGYGEQSGTSMATPNMAGFMAIIRSYIEKDLSGNDKLNLLDENGELCPQAVNRLATQLTMSTAATVYDQDNLPYSPRKQGAGVAKLENVVKGTSAYLFTDVEENDYRPKIEYGDDAEKTGIYSVSFKINNFGDEALTFKPNYEFMTETLASDGLAVSEQAYMLDDNAAIWSVDGKEVTDSITVAAGEVKEISVTLSLSDKEKAYIDKSFKNGMYVEGFLKLASQTEGQCDLSIPFLAFYGDWNAAPMLDYSAFEVAASEQDASIKDEDKIQASVWATLPYASYYNEKYIVPMGGYLYLLDENDEPMYVDEAHCSVSRYNNYYGVDNAENYMTTTSIKALYAGLLRNARVVKYKLYSVETGELLLEDQCNRVSKALTGGGSGIPANVLLELFPDDYNLAANGQYRMDFEFFKDEPTNGEVAPEENTFSFSFTVDYEAPVLENVSVRYYNYKDGNKEKQRIYLDIEVYDNHYAQAIMLCYPKVDQTGQTVLQLATDYPTPVRNANRNGTTTVSIEITDIYEHMAKEFGNQIYLQMDDYALNNCLYRIQLGDAATDKLPENGEFDLAEGEENLSLDIYQTHKVSLIHNSQADTSNFIWKSKNSAIAAVKNGEIVGISAGTTQIIVSNSKGDEKLINVTVSDKQSADLVSAPSIKFGVIKTDIEALTQASGAVEVKAGQEFTLTVETDPWYHPMTDLKIVWSPSSNESVATVDDEGNVKTLKKGTAIITATLYKKKANGDWEQTLYSATVILRVQNEFTANASTITAYNGLGYNAWICPDCNEAWNVEEMQSKVNDESGIREYFCPDCNVVCEKSEDVLKIPTELNAWYIGESAFEYNTNIKKIIIPESVMQINEFAFQNCTALEEVYFVSLNKRDIATADLTMISQYAFAGCPNLRKVDFSNVKVTTIANDAFWNCTALEEIVDMPSIGTMHDRAFMGCTALKSVDLSGLHMSGSNVFDGCTSLYEIKTGKFTAIGAYMFNGCTALRNVITLETPKIGEGAFFNCVNLAGVQFDSNNEGVKYDIGARAFENCGRNLSEFTIDFGDEWIRSIGDRAFAGSSLRSMTMPEGLEKLGANLFMGSYVTEVELGNANLEDILGNASFVGVTLTAKNSNNYEEEDGVIYGDGGDKLLYVNSFVTGEFTVPNSVEEIGAYAFASSNVSTVTLGRRVEKIGEGAFINSSIYSIDFNDAPIVEIPAYAFNNTKISEIVLPETVTTIGEGAFASSALVSFKGVGLTTIGRSAFSDCVVLSSVELPDSVTTIGSSAFSGCVALKEITLPSVQSMGDYVFSNTSALEKIVFGENVTVAGRYTFNNSSVKEVVLGGQVTEIGEGLFYNASRLTTIELPAGVTKIGHAAFSGARALKELKGLENVVTIGEQAFYNAGLTKLNLDSAKEIGIGAFAAEDLRTGKDTTASYSEIHMPNVVTIGMYAFLNGGEAVVEIPATTTKIGFGAFASSNKLTTITVAEENTVFFAEDNVLYRNINKDNGEYELVCYPAARVIEGEEKSYAIKEGTLVVLREAFYGLNKDALKKVVLPYSINTIGDSAFFESGVKEYTFESIQAPVLETIYRQEIVDKIEAQATTATASFYKGYYYANFETYVLNYTKFGSETSDLIMNYPDNGTGYENHIYTTYFATRNKIGVMMEDETRACVTLVNGMPSAEEVAGWMDWTVNAENTAKIEQFSETVKTARLYYNNVLKNESQKTYITEEITNKLLAVETQLREVKAKFNISLKIASLSVAENSTHKSTYKEGEFFKMDGLVIVIVYDDYSTETADSAKLVLSSKNEAALTKYDRYVTVSYEGKDVRVAITVTEEGAGETEEEGKKEKGCSSSAMYAGFALTLAGVGMVCRRRKEND